MAKWKISLHFKCFWVCFKVFPVIQIMGILITKSSKKKARVPHGPFLPVHNVFRKWPRSFVFNIWPKPCHSLPSSGFWLIATKSTRQYFQKAANNMPLLSQCLTKSMLCLNHEPFAKKTVLRVNFFCE